jgi:hypothetical protein
VGADDVFRASEITKSWLFPAESEVGHLVEHKEERDVLSKWGNDLRQSYRTLAQQSQADPDAIGCPITFCRMLPWCFRASAWRWLNALSA